jgi:hypothetical protein
MSSAQADGFIGGAEHEFAGVQDEGLVALHLHQPGQLRLFLGGVDVGVFVVVEQPEKPVNPDVHGRRLHHRGVVRFKNNPLGVYFGTNVAVRDQHSIKNTALS